MNALVRAAVAFAAALLGLGGFVAVQAATGPDDQQARRDDSLAALSTVDDSPSPDDSVARQDAPDLQDDAATPGADDPSTRTGHDAVTSGPTDDTSGSDTHGDDTHGDESHGDNSHGDDSHGDDSHGDDDGSGSSSGRG